MDPTRKKHPKSSSAFALPDPTSRKFSSTQHNPGNLPPRVDARLQAKAMTVSVIAADSSDAFIIKPSRKNTGPAAKMDDGRLKREKEKKGSQGRRDIKIMPSKAASDAKKVSAVAKERESQQEQRQGPGQGQRHGHDIMRRPSAPLGRRRSFCSSQVELAGFLASTGVKVVSVDMPPFMQIHAVDCARNAYDSLEKFTSKTLALTLKKVIPNVTPQINHS